MLADVERVDRLQWSMLSREMSAGLQREIASAPTGEILRQRLAEQVGLIKSIPLDAARRVHELTLRGLETASRGDEIRQAILASGDVSKSRAILIARTEVARTASLLTQARAEHIGATQYIWRTSGDSAVRSDHKALNGKVFSWASPPVADQRSGARAHPGCIYNCRCYPEPIIPE